MARPLKDGVDYFPKDTDFYNDDKVRLLRGEFGAKGMYLLDYILCDLYGKNGYYMKWDDSKCFLVSDGAGCGCVPGFVAEFIAGCIRCGIFDKTVFNMFSVLTSAGIQRRFIRMLKSRNSFTFYEEYFLLNINNEKDVPQGILDKLAFEKVSDKENGFKIKENPVKSTENSQNKIEENKIDKNKGNKAHARGKYQNVYLTEEEYESLISQYGKEKTDDYINRVDEYCESAGRKYNNYLATIELWIKKDESKTKTKGKFNNYSEDRELSDFEKQMLKKRFENEDNS